MSNAAKAERKDAAPSPLRLPGTADSAPFLCLLVTAGLLASLFASKVFTLVFLSLVAALLFLNAQEPSRTRAARPVLRGYWAALAPAVAYFFLSALWSSDPAFTLVSALKVLVLLGAASLALSPHFSRQVLATLTTRLAGAAWLWPLVLSALAATLAGAAFDSFLYPNQYALLSDVNKLLATAFPLILVLAACLGANPWRAWFLLWLLSLAFLFGEHIVGPLAFALTLFVLPVAALTRRPEWILPAAGLAASLAILGAAMLLESEGALLRAGAESDGLLRDFLLRANADDRQMIWLHSYRLFLEEPWFGHGFRMSRFVLEAQGAGNLPAHMLHPHNFTLQILVETGIVGAALIAAGFTLAWTRLLGTMNRQGKLLATVLGFSFLVVWAAGFGVWQSYLLGAFFSGLTLIRLSFRDSSA